MKIKPLLIALTLWCFVAVASMADKELDELEALLTNEQKSQKHKSADSAAPEVREGNTRLSDVPKLEHSNDFTYKQRGKIIMLNKITAKSEIVVFKVAETKKFGKLSVQLGRCAKSLDKIKPASFMLITVLEQITDQPEKNTIFHGWMDSSNLSISVMEHPVYEILPVECMN